MNDYTTAVGGAITAVLVGGTLVARSLVGLRGRGRHRAPRPTVVRPAPDETPESTERHYCPAEQRHTDHGAMPCGALLCLDCGQTTEAV